MKLKNYLISIEENYSEYQALISTPYFYWTQEQQLLANILHEAMSENLICNVNLYQKSLEAAE